MMMTSSAPSPMYMSSSLLSVSVGDLPTPPFGDPPRGRDEALRPHGRARRRVGVLGGATAALSGLEGADLLPPVAGGAVLAGYAAAAVAAGAWVLRRRDVE